MRAQRVVPLLVPPLRRGLPEDMGTYETKARGMAVLTTPMLNKGTAFSAEEREFFEAVLKPSVLSGQAGAASRNVYLTAVKPGAATERRSLAG